MTVLLGRETCRSTAGAVTHYAHPSQPAGGGRPPAGRQPDVALAAASAVAQQWHTELLLTPPALPRAARSPGGTEDAELADLREANRRSGTDIGRAESAICAHVRFRSNYGQ